MFICIYLLVKVTRTILSRNLSTLLVNFFLNIESESTAQFAIHSQSESYYQLVYIYKKNNLRYNDKNIMLGIKLHKRLENVQCDPLELIPLYAFYYTYITISSILDCDTAIQLVIIQRYLCLIESLKKLLDAIKSPPWLPPISSTLSK